MKDANRAPFYACLYHGLCDTARKHGYALAIHGSVVTDLDLIAVPWTDAAASPEVLHEALAKHIGAMDFEGITRHFFQSGNEAPVQEVLAREKKRQEDAGEVYLPCGAEVKPHGRIAWTLYLEHGAKVDLSIMPLRRLTSPSDGRE